MSKKLHLSSGQRWLVDVHLAVSRLDHAPVNSWDVLQREAAPWVKK